MAVTAMAADVLQAREKAYAAAGRVLFRNSYCRKDIGLDIL
jgi:phosphoribosylamine-glycine ligase